MKWWFFTGLGGVLCVEERDEDGKTVSFWALAAELVRSVEADPKADVFTLEFMTPEGVRQRTFEADESGVMENSLKLASTWSIALSNRR